MTLTDVLRTAGEAYDPDDTTDLIGLALIFVAPSLVAAIAAIVGAVITVRGQRKGAVRWKGDRRLLDDVHKQTVNDHPEEENFREQVDRIEARQERQDTLLGELAKDVRGLRRDDGVIHGQLRDHAEAQRSLETRVVQAFRREHPDADPL